MDYVRRYWHIIVGVVCVVVLGIIYLQRDTGPPPAPSQERIVLGGPSAVYAADATYPTGQQITAPQAYIVVHIEGAVNVPGVYTLAYGSRVNDLLTAAGGATEDADLVRINLAAFLEDAQQIIIPTMGEEIAEGVSVPEPIAGSSSDGLININTADAAQLRTLPGIGEVISGNIVTHRETNGPFTTVDQLINVPRVGPGVLENIRNLITVE